MSLIKKAKIELRETKNPFFDDEEIDYYINEKHKGNFNAAMYEMCLLKAEDDSISLPGGTTLPSNRDYWLMQAEKYKVKRAKLL